MTCILPAALVHGQAGGGNAGTNIPVLVVIEDEDLASVKRSSDMFKRLMAELRTAMQYLGFQMLDEESLFADQGFGTIPDRRSKTALITDIKSLTLSDDARHQIRVWVLLRVRAAAVDTQAGMTRRVHVRVDGEIYDAQSNHFLDSFDQTKWTATTPTCVKNQALYRRTCRHRRPRSCNELGEHPCHEAGAVFAKYWCQRRSRESTRTWDGHHLHVQI